MKKYVCANCHFFCRQYRGDAGLAHTLEVTEIQRTNALKGDLSWQKPQESLACFKGIWDEGFGIKSSDKLTCISKQSRKGKCYFYAFQPGMLMHAAEKLEQESVAKSNDLAKYRLAIYTLILAIIGLLIKLVYDKT
ncbi:MAG TPA: hypothetical protein VI279_14760 [Rhodocyclaceae bacterium]